MKYALAKSQNLQSHQCLAAGFFSDSDLKEIIPLFGHSFQEIVPSLLEKMREPGEWTWQNDLNGQSLMLIHCGKREEFTSTHLLKRLADINGVLLKQQISSATLFLPQIVNENPDWQLTQMLLQIEGLNYCMDTYKSQPKKRMLDSVDFFLPGASIEALDAAVALSAGMQLTKDLANMPANHCTPTFLGKEAEKLAKEYAQITAKVHDVKAIKKLQMGALLAVAQGSAEPPCFIELTYQDGSKQQKPIVIVGKGVTFDSGGLSIKPANVMDEMKYDMAGAASILGTLKTCALLKLPITVIGLIPTTENMPGGRAVKPGDIVTSMSGQSIEIINTDAEGRLILADALTYAERFDPDLVIDIATLTGAIVVALGSVNTGLMTTDEPLAQELMKASKQSNDKCWRMPLEEDYQEALESPLADMINANFDRVAGSITAACFLSRFTKKYRWAHLDVAGTAWVSGKKRQATGRPVPLLVEFLRHAARSAR